MTDSTNTDDLDDEGTPMGRASPVVRLPFAESHKPAIVAGDKTATLRVDSSHFAQPGRTVELVATDDGEVWCRRTITAEFRVRAYRARQLLEAIDGAKHSCLDTETPINEILAPYYTDDVTSATVVQGIVWSTPTVGQQ
jgi:hypothetical protein